MMKVYSVFLGAFLVIISAFSALTCSPTGTSQVTIHINLGLSDQNAFNIQKESFFDRIFRFFAKDAEAQTAPSNITLLTLNISASDMTTITIPYSVPPFPDTITLEVPAGSSRTFEVIVSIDPSDPRAVLSYRGTATRDLASGATVDIPISMGIYETKIVIPDARNSRICQIEDINGGWVTPLTNSDFGYSNQFQPQDIDFDSTGRIYIANVFNSAGSILIFRFDDITDTTDETIIDEFDISNSVTSLAIDRSNKTNNILYYSTTSAIWQNNIDGTNPQDITSYFTGAGISSFTNIRGLAVDNSSNLYLAANFTISGIGRRGVIKYVPSTNAVSWNFSDFVANDTPWDVVAKGNYLYVANYSASVPADRKIIQLTLNLGYYNVLTTDGSDTFLGPHRFLAILNNRFYLIDENEEDSINSNERIVAFDDFSSTWNNYIPTVPQGSFQFFSSC